MDDPGMLATIWTARLAVAGWLARVAIDVAAAPSPRRDRLARAAWTLGCVAYVAHVLCAFHFVHDWSHERAWRHTAERTAEVVGRHWGLGLWVNYAFTALWSADVLRWWLVGVDRPPTRIERVWTIVVHATFAFLMINATVVFGPAWWRWAAIPVGIGMIALRLRRRASGA